MTVHVWKACVVTITVTNQHEDKHNMKCKSRTWNVTSSPLSPASNIQAEYVSRDESILREILIYKDAKIKLVSFCNKSKKMPVK